MFLIGGANKIMPFCYFNNDYTKEYQCTYSEFKDSIEVNIEYDIEENEIEEINGARIISTTTEYANRDILILDNINKINILVKNAFHAGHSNNYSIFGNSSTTKFTSFTFFKEDTVQTLHTLQSNPQTKLIRIYSTSFSDLLPFMNYTKQENNETISYTIQKQRTIQRISIEKDYIDSISISNNCKINEKSQKIVNMNFSYFLEIKLSKQHSFTTIRDFVNELIIYMQLYYPDKFIIDKVKVNINNVFYTYVTNFLSIKSKNGYVHKSVQVDLLTFLANCYTNISYRSAKSEIRNSKDVIITKSRHLENLFGSYYRFIECYLKKKGYKNDFMIYALEHYYNQSLDCEKKAKEIITLRNHYIHSGYYIKNDCLKIRFTPKENKQNYSVDANVKWIYNQTLILYKTAIDIIFKEILNYPEYKYKQSF